MAAGNGAPFLAVTGGERRVAPVHGGACRPFGRIRVLPKDPPAARPPPPATRRTLVRTVVVVCYQTGPMRFVGTLRGSPYPSLSMSARTASAIADPAGGVGHRRVTESRPSGGGRELARYLCKRR